MSGIFDVLAREILDSRGLPTVEVEVVLENGIVGRASVPSGDSAGTYGMLELRDGDLNRYLGQGVSKAVENVEETIAPHLIGRDVLEQMEIDMTLVALDETPDKSRLGANAIFGVSMACVKAAAEYLDLPLYRYLGGIYSHALPVPMMNVLDGGPRAGNNLDIREIMIVPAGAANIREAIRMGSEVFHRLKEILKDRGDKTTVGDKGGFAPDLGSNREALELTVEAIQSGGYHPGRDIFLAIDSAASGFYQDGMYLMKAEKKREKTTEEMVAYYEALLEEFPIISIEDGLAQDDWEGWRLLTDRLGRQVQLVGDDLFVTDFHRLRRGISEGVANAILVKPNQAGTVSATFQVIEMAKRAGWGVVVSHRSGETEDTAIAELAVAVNAGQIKTGALSRTDRICKYNQLIRMEENLGETAEFSGLDSYRSVV